MATQPTPETESFSLDALRTIPQMVQAHPDKLSEQTIRWQLRHRQENGLASACIKIGKKILIHQPRYEKWLAGRAGV